MIVNELQFLDGDIRIPGTSLFLSHFTRELGWTINVEGNVVHLTATEGVENGYPRPMVEWFTVVGASFSYRAPKPVDVELAPTTVVEVPRKKK